MSTITSAISRFILKIFGWKITGSYAHEVPKKVMIAAPHTSGWDLPLGLLVRSAVKADIGFVGKKSLFRPPLGWFMRWVGGVPVDREKSSNFVDALVQVYNEQDRFNFMIAPEGTRKKVEKFKTGFYYVAKEAGVPIQMISLNFKDRIVNFSKLFYPSDNAQEDIATIENHFRGIRGKIPEYSFT